MREFCCHCGEEVASVPCACEREAEARAAEDRERRIAAELRELDRLGITGEAPSC